MKKGIRYIPLDGWKRIVKTCPIVLIIPIPLIMLTAIHLSGLLIPIALYWFIGALWLPNKGEPK